MNITNIPKENIPIIIKKLEIDAKNGNPALDNIRCIYTKDDTNIIYLFTAFDFIDLNPRPEIRTLTIGQVLEN